MWLGFRGLTTEDEREGWCFSRDEIPSAYYCSSSSSLTSRVDRASLFIGLTRYVNDERVAGRKARRRLLLSFFLHRLVCNSVTRAAAGARDLFFLSDAFTLDGAEKFEIYKIPLHGNPPREFLTFSRLTVYCVVIDFSGLSLLHWDARLFRSFS